MARVVAVKEYLEKALKDESKPWTKLFILAEEKTGVDRLYIFVGELRLLRSFPSSLSISRLRCVYLDNCFYCQLDHPICQQLIISCLLRNITSFFRAVPFNCSVNISDDFPENLLPVALCSNYCIGGVYRHFESFAEFRQNPCIFSTNKILS